MIDVYVFNGSQSAKREAQLCLTSGVIKFKDGTFSHISGESARGCLVKEIEKKVEPKPEPKPEEKKVDVPGKRRRGISQE